VKKLLLVDGYNVINGSPRYRKLKDRDMDAARGRLIEDVAAYAKLAETDAAVVFDASERSGVVQRTSTAVGVLVVFTRGGHTADQTIERMAHEARLERAVTVATSDYAQQKTVFANGVLRMSASELLARISDEKEEAGEHKRTGRRRVFLEDRIDSKIRDALRKLQRE